MGSTRSFIIPNQWDKGGTTVGIRQRAENNRWIEREFNNLGISRSWRPVLSSGWAMGNSTYTARFTDIGQWCVFYANIVLGDSATMGTTLTASLPLPMYNTASEQIGNFHATAFDTSVPAACPLVVVAHGNQTVTFDALSAAGTYVINTGITATAPFTWVAGDELFYGGAYEIR